MKKIILIAVVTVVLLGGGIGGTFFYLSTHHAATAHKLPPPPKPIYFAQLADLVVTVPADTGDSTSTYVQITLQFSSFDPNAVTDFSNLQPIIKSQIISLLMSETVKTLGDPATRATLVQNCLKISNNAVNTSGNFTPKAPFTAAYITSFVVQN